MAAGLRDDAWIGYALDVLDVLDRTIPQVRDVKLQKRRDGTLALKGSFEGMLRNLIDMALQVGRLSHDHLGKSISWIDDTSTGKPKLALRVLDSGIAPAPLDDPRPPLKEGSTLDFVIGYLETLSRSLPQDYNVSLTKKPGEAPTLTGTQEGLIRNFVEMAETVAKTTVSTLTEPIEWFVELENEGPRLEIALTTGGTGQLKPNDKKAIGDKKWAKMNGREKIYSVACGVVIYGAMAFLVVGGLYWIYRSSQ